MSRKQEGRSAELDLHGLSSARAREQLRRDGPNEITTEKHGRALDVLISILAEPMLLLLLGCGGIYLLLGDAHEAVILLGFVVVIIVITFVQSQKTERAIEALRDLSAPRALVIRDGHRQRIPGRELVVGDLMILAEGDRVPADGDLLDTRGLRVDESLLTGEAVPVSKAPDGTGTTAEDTNRRCIYSGTLVVSGQGVAKVIATGAGTRLGMIGSALSSIESGESALRGEIRVLVRRIAAMVIAMAIFTALVLGLSRGDWLTSLLAAITLAMALLPEEFPVVLTLFLALGARRMARRKVLTRQLAALETLGSATALCVDKTGTLTQNRMKVAFLTDAQGVLFEVGDQPLPEAAHSLVEYAILATPTDPFDPMERAINELGLKDLVDAAHLHKDWSMLRQYPLSDDLLAMTQVWRSRRSQMPVIAAKGAPESIASLCHLDDRAREQVMESVRQLTGRGLRVLAVAMAEATHEEADLDISTPLPGHQHSFEFHYQGLIGLVDPLRETVPGAIAQCRDAGIRVMMITGDYPGTACTIARQAGIINPDDFLTGAEIGDLSDRELAGRLASTNVIARALPEHKLRIIRALQSQNQVVGMTGDGVNDAPALRAADIGIAMGGRGTDVAREAADLVVVDDNFASIVDAVRVGRRVYANLQRAFNYIIAVHVPIAALSMLPVLTGWPLILLPVHVAFLQLIIDPTCSIAFEAEPEDPDTMKRPPRPAGARLIGRSNLGLSIVQGMLVFFLVGGAGLFARVAGYDQETLRALTFAALVLGNLGLILTNRSRSESLLRSLGRKNRPLWVILAGATISLALILTLPSLAALFQFSPPPWPPLIGALIGALILTGLIDMGKRVWLHRFS